MNTPLILQNSDGSWKYTNKLIHSSSPYLYQHAHNPVEWYPWGEEAIALARAQDKPLLVSIGYSTCYWCHVMERQIFCDPAMAELMNASFINIKIDREERPDLDAIYMAARQLMTREGGWPNNVVLTTDLKPFFAGGTFAVDNRYGKPSFPEIIFSITNIWKNKRETVLKSAEEVTQYIHAQLAAEKKEYAIDSVSDSMLPDRLFEQLLTYADKVNGGFFHAPKFPQESYLLFLLNYYRLTGTKEALDSVTSSLDKMAAGGIYDHIGGGFHRYAVDEEWKVPHFEKMLYNQSLLVRCYSEAFLLTQDKYYRYIVENTLDFVLSVLMGEEGGFYSALDAETDEIEGAYYIWEEGTIRSLFSAEEADLFFSCFSLAEVPQFQGHKHMAGGVLYVHDLGRRQEMHQQLLPLLGQLKNERNKRLLPLLDTKIITAWHSMMVATLVRAGHILQDSALITLAEKGGVFILRSLQQEDGRLLRIATSNKQEKLYGFLEDYAFTIQAFLALHEATHKPDWLNSALLLTNTTLQLFEDREGGGFFFSEDTQETIIRIKDADDSSIPSANAIMLHNMVKLLEITADPLWYSKAEHIIAAFKGDLQRSPISYTHMIEGMARLGVLHKRYAAHTASGYVRVEVIEKPQTVRIHEPFTIKIKISIDKGWHIYAGKGNVGNVIPTRLAFSSHAGLKIGHIHYPSGKPIHGFMAEEAVFIYEGEVFITAEITLDTLIFLTEPLQIAVLAEWQPCNNEMCLALEGVKLEFSVIVENRKKT